MALRSEQLESLPWEWKGTRAAAESLGDSRLLIVDDDRAVRDALRRALILQGCHVDVAADGDEALLLIAEGSYDIVVLDVLLPGTGGLEVCRRLRAASDRTPVLMLTALDAVAKRVEGLDAGADDYLVKPFALEELHARLRALQRRSAPQEPRASLCFADLVLYPSSREVRRGTRSIALTRTEFSLLELFLMHPHQVLTRSQIFEHVWGYDFGVGSNSLHVYVGYLRSKIERDGGDRLIHTVRGVGYVLRRS